MKKVCCTVLDRFVTCSR